VMEQCDVCGTSRGVATMTSGVAQAVLCDGCRPMVVTFFHVYRDLTLAVAEVRLAKTGKR